MSPATILVVDDDKDILETMDLVLRMEGYRTQCARSGGEAVTMLRQIAHCERPRPQLVLLDLMLPDMRGEDVLQQIREILGGDLPVVVMSAAVDATARAEGMGLSCLAKPFEIGELMSLCARLARA